MLKLLAASCCLFASFSFYLIDGTFSLGAYAFMIVPQRRRTAIRHCREHFAKRSKSSQRSSGSGFGKKQSTQALLSKKAEKIKSSKDNDLIFITHFSNYGVLKQDVINLLSMCHEMQQSSMQWADSCIVTPNENQVLPETIDTEQHTHTQT
eukprot:scaffold112250_cov22-Cyclotella_meneghiniana.AAC.1